MRYKTIIEKVVFLFENTPAHVKLITIVFKIITIVITKYYKACLETYTKTISVSYFNAI